MLYAIGDVHGELEKLEELLESLPLGEGDRLIFLGDYVDRGRDSFGVIERLIELQFRKSQNKQGLACFKIRQWNLKRFL